MERTKKVEVVTTRTKKANPVKIYDFVLEIQKTVHFTDLQLQRAQRSRIDTKLGPYFKSLVLHYRRGDYCNSMDDLGDKIKYLLTLEYHV